MVTGYSHSCDATVRRDLYLPTRIGSQTHRYISRNSQQEREAMKKLAALTLSIFLTYGIALAKTGEDSKDAAKANPAAETSKSTAAPNRAAKAAAPAKAAAKAKTGEEAGLAAAIEELRQTLQAQQEQLDFLKEELAKRDKQINEARE